MYTCIYSYIYIYVYYPLNSFGRKKLARDPQCAPFIGTLNFRGVRFVVVVRANHQTNTGKQAKVRGGPGLSQTLSVCHVHMCVFCVSVILRVAHSLLVSVFDIFLVLISSLHAPYRGPSVCLYACV